MTTTRTPKAPLTVGQAVEVRSFDFKAPGMPEAWFPGVVEEVEAQASNHGPRVLFSVLVRMADGRPHRELVGPRGGGRVRKAAPAPAPDFATTEGARMVCDRLVALLPEFNGDIKAAGLRLRDDLRTEAQENGWPRYVRDGILFAVVGAAAVVERSRKVA